jgi:hypothetical protein
MVLMALRLCFQDIILWCKIANSSWIQAIPLWANQYMERLDWSQGEPKDRRRVIRHYLVVGASTLSPKGSLPGQLCHNCVISKGHILVILQPVLRDMLPRLFQFLRRAIGRQRHLVHNYLIFRHK